VSVKKSPPSNAANWQRVSGLLSHSATSAFCFASTASKRARSSFPAGTAASTSLVTSRNARGTWMRKAPAFFSSARVRAR
jgi:hypothetical protein